MTAPPSATPTAAALEMRGITKRFPGVVANDHVDFTVRRGEIHALLGRFEDRMPAGQGFIALAAVVFGKWTPLGALGAALLFGVAEALPVTLQIQGINVPFQLIGLLPYVLTIVVLAGLIGRATPPAAIGVPYVKR